MIEAVSTVPPPAAPTAAPATVSPIDVLRVNGKRASYTSYCKIELSQQLNLL